MADRRPYTVCWRKARSRQELAGHAASIAKSEEELTKELEEKSTETIIDEINQKIAGEKIKIYG
jgi:hypothetical protein